MNDKLSTKKNYAMNIIRIFAFWHIRFVCYYQKILLNERGGGHEQPSPSPPATLLWLTALARLPDQKDTLSKRLNNVDEYHF